MMTALKDSLRLLLMGFLLVCTVQELQTEEVNLALSTTRIFYCTTAAFTLIWTVNGVRVDFAGINGIVLGAEERLGGGLLRRSLTVTAREEHDGLDLQCSASSLQGNIMIVVVLEVHLRIQGLLSFPDNVSAVNGSSSILLSWTAPFTLDITDVDPDISHYTVYITNLNTRRVGEENVTETEFIFTSLPEEGTPDPCSTYQFRVSAWNVVGEGNRSEPVYGQLTNDIEVDAGSTTATPALTQAEQIAVGEPTTTAVIVTATATSTPQVEQPSVTPTVGSSITVRLNPSQSASGPAQYQEIVIITSGAGGACTLIALMLMLTCTVAFCCIRRKKNYKANSHDINMKVNQAYEVRVIGRRSAPVEPCPAYGVVGSRQ